MKTTMVEKENIARKMYVFNAEDQVLGRLACQVANLLRGKGKPTFAPHVDMGDNVVVFNVDKIILTGKKLTQKFDFRYSGYPGGEKLTPYSILMKTNPQKAFRLAVKGMLPPNKLRDKVIKKLKIFKGAEIPAQYRKIGDKELA